MNREERTLLKSHLSTRQHNGSNKAAMQCPTWIIHQASTTSYYKVAALQWHQLNGTIRYTLFVTIDGIVAVSGPCTEPPALWQRIKPADAFNHIRGSSVRRLFLEKTPAQKPVLTAFPSLLAVHELLKAKANL